MNKASYKKKIRKKKKHIRQLKKDCRGLQKEIVRMNDYWKGKFKIIGSQYAESQTKMLKEIDELKKETNE